MADREIDWDSAEVRGAKLTVGISGEAKGAKQWSERVQTVLRVLDRSGGKWGEIKVSAKNIQVADLREGAEPDLRHLLESAILQANTDLAPDEPDEDEKTDESDADEDERSGDQQMTESFHSFGSGSDTDEAQEQGEGEKRGE